MAELGERKERVDQNTLKLANPAAPTNDWRQSTGWLRTTPASERMMAPHARGRSGSWRGSASRIVRPTPIMRAAALANVARHPTSAASIIHAVRAYACSPNTIGGIAIRNIAENDPCHVP